MSCCANKKRDGAPLRSELLARLGFEWSNRAAQFALTLAAPVNDDARLWRDFAAMLADSERKELECIGGAMDPEGVRRLRRILAGRMLRFSPRMAGRVYRRLDGAQPGPLLDLAAARAADLLENDGWKIRSSRRAG
jgi:hypothetical protein